MNAPSRTKGITLHKMIQKIKTRLFLGYPRTKALSLVALNVSLLSIASLISIPIPISPVPITLQVFMVYIITAILGPVFAALVCVIYLAMGAIGLPVFAGAAAGLPILLGPTGGYLFSFPLASFLGGWACRARASSKKMDVVRLCIAFAAVLFTIYVVGILWLSNYLHISFYSGFLIGGLPFFPIDVLKAIVALPVAMRIRWLPFELPVTRIRVDKLRNNLT